MHAHAVSIFFYNGRLRETSFLYCLHGVLFRKTSGEEKSLGAFYFFLLVTMYYFLLLHFLGSDWL